MSEHQALPSEHRCRATSRHCTCRLVHAWVDCTRMPLTARRKTSLKKNIRHKVAVAQWFLAGLWLGQPAAAEVLAGEGG